MFGENYCQMRKKRHPKNPFVILAKTRDNAQHDSKMKIAIIDELHFINEAKFIMLSTNHNPLTTVEKIDNIDLRTMYELADYFKQDVKLPNWDCRGSHIILTFNWGHLWLIGNLCSN